MSFYKKPFSILIAILIIALLILGYLLFQSSDNDLHVYFLDVGMGDAIFIKTPDGQQVLIDGGPDNSVVSELGKHLPFYNMQIDLMILTHPHADHVTGQIEILERYPVRQVLSTGVVHTTPEYRRWLELIQAKKIDFKLARAGQEINLGEVKLRVLYPEQDFSGQTVDNLNNTSVVVKLIYGQTSFLLVGDAEISVEQELLGQEIDLRADVLKVGHQGSSDANSQEFLAAVQPTYAVISVGPNQYGHPSLQIIRRLERLGAQILRTDEWGTVEIISNGATFNIR